jgi:hypothetical protein
MVQIEQDYYRMLGVATEDSVADIKQQGRIGNYLKKSSGQSVPLLMRQEGGYQECRLSTIIIRYWA